MPRAHLLPLVLTCSLLSACSGKSTDDDDDGGGGADTGTSWDGGMGDGGVGDGGAGDGGTGDGGISDGGAGDGGVDDDVDGDGYGVSAGDCADDDETIHPDAYDRPDDGIDQDCADGDRHFEGRVIDPGDLAVIDLRVPVGGEPMMDLVFILEHAVLNGSTYAYVDLDDVIDAAEDLAPGVQAGVAIVRNYDAPIGTNGDLPFTLGVQVTSDTEEVVDFESDLGAGTGGGTGGEYTVIEGLYQALTGDGYDFDCDGSYDEDQDVPPFIPSPTDAFGGTAAGSRDETLPGGGTVGGMGFREGAVPVFIYVTAGLLRDPDAGDPTPGGCPLDAGTEDLIDAADALDAFVVGVKATFDPIMEHEALAREGGWLLDKDGDGTNDDLALYTAVGSYIYGINDELIAAVEDVIRSGVLYRVYDEVRPEVATDELGLVSGITPSNYTSVDTETTAELEFAIQLTAPATVDEATQTTVVVQIMADGQVLATEEILVELAPGG